MTDDKIIYQAAVLPSTVTEKLTLDDSPGLFVKWFWEFMGVDIQNANIMPWDFQNILDMVDIAFVNILGEYLEQFWGDVVVAQYKRKVVGGVTVQEVEAAYHVTKLWDMIRAKTYMKMCRAREGFTLKQLTEHKSKSEQHVSGYPGGAATGIPSEAKEREGKSWGL